MEFSDHDIDIYLDLDNNHPANPYIYSHQSPPHNNQNSHQDISQQSQILLSNSIASKNRNTTQRSHIPGKRSSKTMKQATASYRERKKMYVKDLEQSVKELEQQIRKTDQQITITKDQILQKLIKTSKSIQNSENAEIFTQLETLLIPSLSEAEIDMDKVNLLLDTLKYRIGPTGRERQAKLTYNFKNIINTLFPGLHRYMMATSVKNLDFYKQQPGQELGWTSEFRRKLQLTPQQQQKLKSLKIKLSDSHQEVMKDIQTLLHIKGRLKEEGIRFNNTQNQFRECMNPAQCGRWTLWCEKYKYHQDIFLQQANLHFYEKGCLQTGYRGRKRVPRSDSDQK